MVSSPSHGGIEKKYWWLTNKKIVALYVKDARSLIASQEQSNIASAINLLDAALALSPRFEPAMELKATSLLHLRRFKEVADMLQDYIPSLKISSDDSSSSSSSISLSSLSDNNSQPLARERVKLFVGNSPVRSEQSIKCFSVSDLKKRVMAGLVKNRDKEGQWRYLILDSVKDRARMSSLLLYRLIQRGYTKVMRIVLDEEASEKQRKKLDDHQQTLNNLNKNRNQVEKKNAFQGVFCRDLAVVGNLLSKTGFNRPIQVKYEALSC
ncbi:hypothetical protein L1987_21768 [Smallanthus sonchifolius]|uniref:Uncharacterized protein n=1 Tax=Smallanthus sonchifolius TaxID=185202 RepID=A0ACB9IDM1_9ASTR|nr:hypothetical protein L1987_21768 [Smallanthus sonchifolius]